MAEVYISCCETHADDRELFGVLKVLLRHPSIFGIGFTEHKMLFPMDYSAWRLYREEQTRREDQYRIQVEHMKAMFNQGTVSTGALRAALTSA